MRVNANSEPSGTHATRPARVKAQVTGANQDELTSGGSAKLVSALKQIPEVRAEKVAQARNLIKDPSYPSDALLRKVSGILADNIAAPDKAE